MQQYVSTYANLHITSKSEDSFLENSQVYYYSITRVYYYK